ncbi:lysozyme [Candidatus Pacearchaeota archaeon]|nr:lysozyme [Candidatus Pacearchaeota archaeon]
MTNEIIKKWEMFKPKPYDDATGKWCRQEDLQGIATIGYGTIRYPDGSKVRMTDAPIDENTAIAYVDIFLEKYVNPVFNIIKAPLDTNQKKAIQSLVYNIGAPSFERSTVLKRLNRHDYNGAADAFLMWNKITVDGKKRVSNGLRNRRKDERKLFLTPAYKQKTVAQILHKEIKAPVKENIFVRFIKFLKEI